ncbi:MAG: hypothetical protein U9Q05_00760 [Thermodesulfobacteriota bacterium]|nr:hypothetical protein [Thermodesulfobacteriota bacterium]
MLDISVAYKRFRFIGQEFLTWLWYMIATGEYTDILGEDANFSLALGDRMVLENRHSKDIEIITIKGSQADLKEGVVALSKGALVAELGIVIHVDDQPWKFTLKGESLDMTHLKTPPTGRPETVDDFEGAVFEKALLYETAFQITDQLYHTFIKQRIGNDWDNRIKTKIKTWIKTQDLKMIKDPI